MANSVSVQFRVTVLGDGVSTAVTIDMATAPLIFTDANPTGLSEFLSTAYGPVKVTPTGVTDLIIYQLPNGIASSSLSTTVLTVNLKSPFLGEFVIQGLISY